MWQDPIVEEIRRYGNAYAAQFHEDLAAMFQDLRTKQQCETRRIVTLPPKPYAPSSWLPQHQGGKASSLCREEIYADAR